jgi:hypothetical protein
LYLLLRQALDPDGVYFRDSLREAFIPRKLPAAITVPQPSESFFSRLHRKARQLRYNLVRARFHAVQSLLYLHESRRFRKALAASGWRDFSPEEEANFTHVT